jgi:hypothetical protein
MISNEIMYLIYLDESGTPPVTDLDAFYTLAGLVIHESNWKAIDNDVENIKAAYKLMEIHIGKIWKRHRKSPRSQYARNVVGEIYSLVARSDIVLMCVSIDKFREYQNNPSSDVEFLAWELLIERLNICVDKLCKTNGRNEYGLIIMDERNQEKDTRIRNYLKVLRDRGTRFQNIDRIIEDPVFSPSHWRNLTQLADAIAFCSKSYLKEDDFFSKQFLTIQNKFDKDSKGRINNAGFKVW